MCIVWILWQWSLKRFVILAEGAVALPVTLSGGALFASWKLLQFPSSLIVKVILAIFMRASAQLCQDFLCICFSLLSDCCKARDRCSISSNTSKHTCACSSLYLLHMHISTVSCLYIHIYIHISRGALVLTCTALFFRVCEAFQSLQHSSRAISYIGACNQCVYVCIYIHIYICVYIYTPTYLPMHLYIYV